MPPPLRFKKLQPHLVRQQFDPKKKKATNKHWASARSTNNSASHIQLTLKDQSFQTSSSAHNLCWHVCVCGSRCARVYVKPLRFVLNSNELGKKSWKIVSVCRVSRSSILSINKTQTGKTNKMMENFPLSLSTSEVTSQPLRPENEWTDSSCDAHIDHQSATIGIWVRCKWTCLVSKSIIININSLITVDVFGFTNQLAWCIDVRAVGAPYTND